MQSPCSLCLCGGWLLRIHSPQRRREHGGCTEKGEIRTLPKGKMRFDMESHRKSYSKIALQLLLTVGLLLYFIGASRPQSKSKKSDTATKFETRCGWLNNPTPANIWFYDREAEWTIGVQGGYQTPGDWPWPDFKKGQFVKTNGNHGYGCACLRMRVDKGTHQALEITSAQARPLSSCRRDPNLKRWKDFK